VFHVSEDRIYPSLEEQQKEALAEAHNLLGHAPQLDDFKEHKYDSDEYSDFDITAACLVDSKNGNSSGDELPASNMAVPDSEDDELEPCMDNDTYGMTVTVAPCAFLVHRFGNPKPDPNNPPPAWSSSARILTVWR
jgi:hypothetical protein